VGVPLSAPGAPSPPVWLPAGPVLLGALVLLAVVLLAVAGATARRPDAPVPGREGYLDRWAEGHGGYDPRTAFWPRQWLTLTYAAGAPLARRGVAPDVLTAAGLAVCAVVPVLAALGSGWPLLAVPMLVLSGLVDSLDGAVAVLTGRATRFGYVLDSVVDRLGELLYLLALWLLGAPGGLCVAAGVLAFLLEYARARAGAAGLAEIGVVTVWERATRIVVTAFGLLAAGALGLLAAPLVPWAAGVTAAAWVGLGAVGVVQLLVVLRRRLA